jgi:uncharacterized heparinase superfamily protein
VSAVARYVHTLRYLRPVQVWGRVWYQVRRPHPDPRPAPSLRAPRAAYVTPITPRPSLLAPGQVRLLNVERRCAEAHDWQPAGASKLWIYHLHYFDDLSAQDAASRRDWHREWLERWVRENPPTQGPGWEPYPVSRRILNWVKWALSGNQLPQTCVHSLAIQTRWLTQRLEHHIRGNHLLANAAALVHAGLYFQGAEAQGWYRRGMDLLAAQLEEQLLSDGGHFELSPMYHATVLTDLLDLVNLHRVYAYEVPPDWPARLAAMQEWLETLSHPDGEIAFFNDATGGHAANARATAEYAARLGLARRPRASEALIRLEPSGYLRAQCGPAVLLCDCAAVGPDYLPAHAHADTLSFELSLFGERLLVNSGVSQYGTDAERTRQRGTAAHNTVMLDGQNSSEVWGGFRTARRARPLQRTATAEADVITIEAAHDGYRRLPGRNEHMRRWKLTADALEILDRITGPFESAQAFLHLHPGVQVTQSGTDAVRLTTAGQERSVGLRFAGAKHVEVRPDSWHPQFGVALSSQTVVATFSSGELTTRLEWS